MSNQKSVSHEQNNLNRSINALNDQDNDFEELEDKNERMQTINHDQTRRVKQ